MTHTPPVNVQRSLLDIARQYPEVIEWLREWREKERDTHELGGQELVRGRCHALRDVLSHFSPPTR